MKHAYTIYAWTGIPFELLIQILCSVNKKNPIQLRIGFFISELCLLFWRNAYFLIFLAMASKASGWFIAKSARTLRFNPMLLALIPPMNFE